MLDSHFVPGAQSRSAMAAATERHTLDWSASLGTSTSGLAQKSGL